MYRPTFNPQFNATMGNRSFNTPLPIGWRHCLRAHALMLKRLRNVLADQLRSTKVTESSFFNHRSRFLNKFQIYCRQACEETNDSLNEYHFYYAYFISNRFKQIFQTAENATKKRYFHKLGIYAIQFIHVTRFVNESALEGTNFQNCFLQLLISFLELCFLGLVKKFEELVSYENKVWSFNSPQTRFH